MNDPAGFFSSMEVQFNLLLLGFVAAFAIRCGVQILLHALNIAHLHRHGTKVPRVFKGIVCPEKQQQISFYTIDSAQYGLFCSLFAQALLLTALLSGFLPWLAQTVTSWTATPMGAGLIFFAGLAVVFHTPQIGFDLYGTFVIEARHGFNTKTSWIWLSDLLKGIFLSAALGGVVLGALLGLIEKLHDSWWIWAWLVLAVFEGLILWLYPVVIAPWFNKFEPISDRSLEELIRKRLARAGLSVRGVFQVDATKRTRHTNAYFTGLGQTKRIVLYDSLLHSHTKEEILAILSHEAGHWKKGHAVKQLVSVEIASLVGFLLAARLIDWSYLYETFGFAEPHAFAGLFLAGTFFGLAGFFFRPVTAAVSRRFERQADQMVWELTGSTVSLAEALRKLALDNLANLTPHPLYAWFYYSHPPVVERIAALNAFDSEKKGDETESATQ